MAIVRQMPLTGLFWLKQLGSLYTLTGHSFSSLRCLFKSFIYPGCPPFPYPAAHIASTFSMIFFLPKIHFSKYFSTSTSFQRFKKIDIIRNFSFHDIIRKSQLKAISRGIDLEAYLSDIDIINCTGQWTSVPEFKTGPLVPAVLHTEH